ncbi:MAG: helix-turn-helix domain-containing protein, partial [Thermomicrobiales bacterium]|nr:helix-turn-helix domain-containing protein [Thermomicrobiales bacterium]
MDEQSRQSRHMPARNAAHRAATQPVSDRTSLTTREAAAALGLSMAAIRRAIDTGELAATRHGANWRVASDELVRFARLHDLPLPLVPWERGASHQASPALALHLPLPSSELIGREAEVAQVVALLEDPAVSLLTLTGPGGIGKTRLALAAAESLREHRPGDVIFIDLSPVLRTADAVPAIAQALGLRPPVGQDQLQQIAGYLRSKDLLLVVDNVEQ